MQDVKTNLKQSRKILKEYLLQKAKNEDWHGVADAANDLREIDAKLEILELAEDEEECLEEELDEHYPESNAVTISLWDTLEYLKSLPPLPQHVKTVAEQNRTLREARRGPPAGSTDDG